MPRRRRRHNATDANSARSQVISTAAQQDKTRCLSSAVHPTTIPSPFLFHTLAVGIDVYIRLSHPQTIR
ncbi:hypothetical protein GMOD_00004092 [Pyrenophora seminiperda CCB06]|uniref:Uncharacterized protein n=1 Tax=Pyrenophora seminiperda CCB06 TaxID=1302712 RepID=A0A3M7M0K7_9PLEO|nr:hypothetical protein GMOD_00004092 [Pyrenophora seminiperda CCB06]